MAASRCSTLVSVKWLKDLLAAKPANHRILDATWHLPITGKNGKAEYAQQHIPNAVFFDIDDCVDKSTSVPHMVPPVNRFEEYVGSLGINNDTQIIVYDNNPQFPLFSAQRVWWTFRLFGHSKVSLLEGGLAKWLSEGGEVTAEVPLVETQTFTASFHPALLKSYEEIEKNISTGEFTVVDARPEGRFKGEAPEPRTDTKPGCIPGTKNIPFGSVMNLEARTMKSRGELEAIFKQTEVDLAKPLAVSCGTGVSACLIALAAHLCGKDDVSIYDGSWTEWYHRAPPHLKQNVPE